MKSRIIVFTIFFIALSVNGVFAQSDGIDATATVQTALAVEGVSNLEFGTVNRGEPSTIAPVDAEAGRFDISAGGFEQDVDISFTLPSNLLGPDNAELPISFGENSASWTLDSESPGANMFDPGTGATATSAAATSDEIFVFIGGTVSPGTLQETGLYSGTITITVDHPH